jgi:hypothetical protein
MWASGGVGAGALGVDLRFVLLDDGHYFGFPHVVYGLRDCGRAGREFAGETLVQDLFGLQGGAIEAVGATALARRMDCDISAVLASARTSSVVMPKAMM